LNETRRVPATLDNEPIAGAGGVTSHRPADDPADIWYSILRVLRRRRLLMVSVFAGVVALVIGITLATPKHYTADVKLIAGNPGAATSTGAEVQTGLPVLNALAIPSTIHSAETYVELFGERPIVERVRDQLALDTTVLQLSQAVKIKPVTNTNIISLSATWTDPETAARIANEFAAVFMARETELVQAQATSELSFLAQQMPVAAKRLHDAEAQISTFEATNKIADLGAMTASVVSAAAAIDAKSNVVELEKRQSDAQIASLTSQLAVTQPSSSNGGTVTQNPVLAQLRGQLAQAEVQRDTARQQYTEMHPAMRAAERQVDNLRRQIAQTPATVVAQVNTAANPVYQQEQQLLGVARAASASDTAQISELQKQRTAVNGQLATLPNSARRLAELKREQKSAEDVLNALQTKNNDLLVSRTTALSDVAIVEPASAYAAVRSPHIALNTIVGVILGLLLASAAAFLAELLDGRIRDEQDVEEELKLPVLVSVPLLPSGSGSIVPVSRRPAFQESYFQLVLAMRYSSDRMLRTITITSPLKGDGKSTVAVNVSAALGEIAVSGADGEARVLIIDADMRCPTLDTIFGIENKLGLTDILIGRAQLNQCVHRSNRPGVDVLTSGGHSPNPIKLLQSDRFNALLKEAEACYATVIVDSPALTPLYDAAVIAAQTDGAIMIVSAGQTDVRSTRKALARLDSVGVNLIGTVVNRTTKVEDYGDYFATLSKHVKELPANG
jgi:polysaccharide biosynthesis transport protein